jgi:ABC-2 type transport system permease protein
MLHDSTRRTAALIRLNTVLLIRDPGPLISRLIPPLVFATILRPLYQAAQGSAQGTTQAVISALVTFSLLAMSIVGSSVITERVWHTWERLRTTTARPSELIVGKAVPIMVTLFAQQAIILAFGILVLGMPATNLLLCTTLLVFWTLALLAIGAAVGVLARSYGELAAAYDIGGILLSALGGALVPLTVMPEWVKTVAPVSPGYWATSGIQSSMDGDVSGTLFAATVLLGFTITVGLVAIIRLGRGWGRSDKL